jgi:sporulation protein YlmC with PRC-barrel domain
MSEIVSWLLIEKGWHVVASDGSELGHVEEVTGDSKEDIFDGLAVDPSLLEGPRYVPADLVGEIRQGVVKLTVTHARFERLERFKEPPESIEIEAESASRSQRFTESLRNMFRGHR